MIILVIWLFDKKCANPILIELALLNYKIICGCCLKQQNNFLFRIRTS